MNKVQKDPRVIDVYLGILDLDIEVSVVIENARVDQLELHCG